MTDPMNPTSAPKPWSEPKLSVYGPIGGVTQGNLDLGKGFGATDGFGLAPENDVPRGDVS